MTLGQKIAALIADARLTKVEVAKKIGLANSGVITHWTKDRHKPDRDNIDKLAKLFAKPIDYFKDDAAPIPGGHMEVREISTEISSWTNVPIRGRAPAGTPTEAFDNFLGFYPAPAELVRKDQKNCVCVRAVGNSMIGLQIRDGDTMLVHLQEEASDGDVVIANIDGEGVTCKTFRMKKGVPSLEAAKPSSKPIIGKQFRIVGKVIWRGG